MSAAPVLDAIGVSKKVSTSVIGPAPESASQLPGRDARRLRWTPNCRRGEAAGSNAAH